MLLPVSGSASSGAGFSDYLRSVAGSKGNHFVIMCQKRSASYVYKKYRLFSVE